MKYSELIKTAKEKIPIFSNKYDELLKKNVIDVESGNHIIFSYVFTPLLSDAIKNKDDENIKILFSFLEEMASSDDKSVTEVCDQSVLEELYDEFGNDISGYMGENTLEGLKAVKEYMY